MRRRICVVTGTRAEYGLLRWVMQGVRDSVDLELQLIVTGMHLSPEFGLTYRQIEADGFVITRKVEMLTSSDTPVGVAKSMGLGLIGFADALSELQPDLIVILGDRFEIFAAVASALVAKVPVAHLHGGETTEGAFDESLRHSITKMSQLHFVAAEDYRRRVIQLGEQPDKVFLVGGTGIDNISKLRLLSRGELEENLGLKFAAKNLLITFHPATLHSASAREQMREVLVALEDLRDTRLIFTLPNADTGSRAIVELINEFVTAHANASAFPSLGQIVYLSCVSCVDAVVGNSSSGLTEVPSLKKGTINIGDRQRGRLQASSIINCDPERNDICRALATLYSSEFQQKLPFTKNPYGDGGASERIVETLRRIDLEGLVRKRFFDLRSPA